MIDTMNEITQFSPYAGTLFLQTVSGNLAGRREAENNAEAGVGSKRTMYCYAPLSGCPDAKQCQVLMVLRDGADEETARATMKELELDTLAEEKHFLLLFPNMAQGGWNYTADPSRESDIDYLVRCFGVLMGSTLGVNGFNGMTFYIGTTQSSSALLMTMAATRPLNMPAMMISSFPADYRLPPNALNVEVAAWSSNPVATAYLKFANGVDSVKSDADGVTTWYGSNPNVRLLDTDRKTDAQGVRIAWERLFSETRRWQNDTYGTYQRRTNFAARGFVAHINDSRLGVNNGFGQTWYEYIPPQLRGTSEKVPLLFYFHGGGCVPLYGAEQSGWHDVADHENFIVVYPKASQEKRWNAWNDHTLACSDESFFLALIEHMKNVHPIDEARIYVTGFSMGGMMSNALACALPHIVAAAAPCNAYNEGYFSSYSAMMRRLHAGCAMNMSDSSLDNPDEVTPIRQEADQRKAAYDYRVPVLQISGLLDQAWPITDPADKRLLTFNYWKQYNNIPVNAFKIDTRYESGLLADETCYEGDDGRFLHHRWFSQDEGNPALYELLLAKRMPHAVDLRVMQFAWNYLKKFSRNPDGSLHINN